MEGRKCLPEKNIKDLDKRKSEEMLIREKTAFGNENRFL